MAEFYSARGWEIPPLPWTDLSPPFSPLIAKLIVRDDDRAGAVRRLRRALAGVHILGPATNRGYLAALAALPAFRAGKLHTGFVARHEAALTVGGSPASEKLLALASLAVLEDRATAVRAAAARCADPHSPWHGTDGWRLNRRRGQVVAFRDGGRVDRVNAWPRATAGSWSCRRGASRDGPSGGCTAA